MSNFFVKLKMARQFDKFLGERYCGVPKLQHFLYQVNLNK
ncbi:unnamed protein product [Paramecium sonneborni]|uniref:Uncharacterized protein n=1 Tax=Paramecium sonneborni TaxID=65129 RepID=A0A8S1QPJ3_9CILI|nr:unnamed protein product [Paramecium sonneborni]